MENNIFDSLRNSGVEVTQEQQNQISHRINEILNYRPKIGVFGKTGVGKSSLCNALFGKDLCPVSDVEACTRRPQEVLISMDESGKGVTLVDVPGVGENNERDNEYAELYAKLLPELDLILWVIKADDRALASDERFYNGIVKHHIQDNKPFFFVLNQVDKIEPFREWNIDKHEPSVTQFKNIDRKVKDVASFFNVAPSKVIPVSADERYNLTTLVDEFTRALPAEKTVSTFRSVKNEFRSDESTRYVKNTFSDIVQDVIETVVYGAKRVIEEVGDVISSAAERLWDRITGGCYITTAVCESYGKPDNCYELTQFRKFRDDWLKYQPDGKSLISQYYDEAPQIVENINARGDNAEIYEGIYDNYLTPCLKYIEQGKYNECKETYVTMVNDVKQKYLQ